MTDIAALLERIETLERRALAAEDYRDLVNLQGAYGYYVDKGLWDKAADLFADGGTLEIAERGALVETFDLAHFGRAPARFDEVELARLNAAILHQLPFDHVAGRLPEGMDAKAWEAIRTNLDKVADAADWWSVVTGPVEPPELDEETRAYLAQAAVLLSWSEDPWSTLAAVLKDATGRKGKALFHPLRLALTGRDSGPDMHALLPLIGEMEARRRLEAAAR